MKALLEGRKLLLKAGTIVDATIIGAPSSTKHATKTRDPEMRQTKKGNPWYFGMKVPVQETTLHGDKADHKVEDTLQWELSGGRYLVNKSRKRTDYWDAIHRTRSRVRAEIGRSGLMSPRERGATSRARRHLSTSRRSLTSIFSTPPAIPTCSGFP